MLTPCVVTIACILATILLVAFMFWLFVCDWNGWMPDLLAGLSGLLATGTITVGVVSGMLWFAGG